jgi:predicted RNase H-like HicB family nuclease
MSAKLRKRPDSRRRVSRPFSADVLQRARKIASQYQIVVRQEDGEFYGRGLELPGTMDDAATAEACIAKTRDAMIATVAYMLENGQTPPAPASRSERTVQVNVRMTAEEKLQIEQAAKVSGFDGISDYIRASALAGAK